MEDVVVSGKRIYKLSAGCSSNLNDCIASRKSKPRRRSVHQSGPSQVLRTTRYTEGKFHTERPRLVVRLIQCDTQQQLLPVSDQAGRHHDIRDISLPAAQDLLPSQHLNRQKRVRGGGKAGAPALSVLS